MGWASDHIFFGLCVNKRVIRVSRSMTIDGVDYIYDLSQLQQIIQCQKVEPLSHIFKLILFTACMKKFSFHHQKSICKLICLPLIQADMILGYKWHFEGIIINRVCMNQPSLLELQYLQGRMREGVSLCSNDVDILDRNCSASQCSEIANSLNEIFYRLTQVPLQSYWESFSALITHANTAETRRHTYSTLSTRICREWAAIDENVKFCLKKYIIQRIDMIMNGQEDGTLLNCFNRILVNMLRFEWATLFRDFVANIEEQGLKASPKRILNNLSILQMVLEDGFDIKQEMVPPSEIKLFRQSLALNLRTIFRFFCLCLNNQGPDRLLRVKKCLQTLKISIDYIDVFELFNCNIIELLVGLINAQEFQSSLIACFREIFSFKETSKTSTYHSKIVQKLLLVLEAYLNRYQHDRHDTLDKENNSTEESFQSRKTRRKVTQNQIDLNEDILNLLFEFLNRYVPFMDKAKGEDDLQMEFDPNCKIYYQPSLYSGFQSIYWRMSNFLQNAMEKFDPMLGELTDETLEDSCKMVCCLKLMIVMLDKLKLQPKEEIFVAIEKAIFNFATLPAEFHPFYIDNQLLQNDGAIDLQDMSKLEEQYRQLVQAIMKDKVLSRHFVFFIEQQINNILEGDLPMKKKQQNEQKEDKEYLEYIMNSTNRLCWSAVFAYEFNQEIFSKLKFFKTIQDMAKTSGQPNLHPLIKKSFSVSSKYMAQIYYSHVSISTGLLSTLRTNKNEQITEFTLLLLSKILINQNLQPSFSEEDIEIMMVRLVEVQALCPGKDILLRFYPAFVHMIAVMMDDASKNKKTFQAKETLEVLICKELRDLEAFSQINDTRDYAELQKTIYHFRKLTQISAYLRSASKNSKYLQGCSLLYMFSRCVLSNAIRVFESKYNFYSNCLHNVEKQHFDVIHILVFRQHYISMLRQFTAICLHLCTLKGKEAQMKATKETEKINKMIMSEQALRADFVAQPQFKPKEFFKFALELYRLMIAVDFRGSDDIINSSISNVMESLEGWRGQGEIMVEKFKFWKQLVSFYLWRLSKRNRETLVHIFGEFQSDCTQYNSIELILEIFEQLMEVLRKDCFGQSKRPMLPEFCDMFLATFSNLFSMNCRKESIFERISHLFFSQIEMVRKLETPLKAESHKNNLKNMNVIFVLLQNHITNRTKVKFDNLHTSKLQALFSEQQFELWKDELKEYVLFLMQSYNHSQQQVYQ